MTQYYAYKPNGQIVMTGECPDSMFHLQRVPEAQLAEGRATIGVHYRGNDGQLRTIPPKPGADYVFNYDTKEWARDPALADQIARTARNELLAASDWTQLPDVPLETKAAWAEYRQALRDITEQPGYPDSIVWPIPPQ